MLGGIRWPARPVALMVAVTASLAVVPPAMALPGSFDTSFSGDGRVVSNLGMTNTGTGAFDVVYDSQGRALVAGQSGQGFTVARYTPAGDLDATFGGGDGVFGRRLGIFEAAAVPYALTLDAQGRIVVAGESRFSISSAPFRRFVVRLTTSGELDTTFAQNGVLETDALPVAQSLEIDSQGRFVIGGQTAPNELSVARLTSAGVLDGTFGSGGIATVPIATTQTSFGNTDNMALDASDRVVLAAFNQSDTSSEVFVARLTTSGAPDGGFSGDGVAALPCAGVGCFHTFAPELDVDSQGRVVVASAGFAAEDDGVMKLVAARLTAGGAPDVFFGGGDGWVIHDIASGDDNNDFPYDLAVDGSDRLLVTGQQGEGSTVGTRGVWVARLLSTTGALDSGYGGGDGLASVLNDDATPYALAVDGQGGALAVGQSGDELLLARVTAAGLPDNDFDGDGVVDERIPRPSADYVEEATVDSLGRTIVVGRTDIETGQVTPDYDAMIVRYTAGGELDNSFGGGDGIVTLDLGPYGAPLPKPNDAAEDVAVDSAGRIVVGVATTSGAAVARYTAAGVLDTDFSADGVVFTGALFGGAPSGGAGGGGGNALTGVAMTVDPSDRPILAGTTSNSKLGIQRFTAAGAPDSTLDTDGFNEANDLIYIPDGVAVDSTGRIVVAGCHFVGGSPVLAAARFTSGGQPDASFSGDGYMNGVGGSCATGVAVDASDRPVMSGVVQPPLDGTIAAFRLTAAGEFDQSFGIGGAAAASTTLQGSASDIAIDSAGRIVVAGAAKRNSFKDHDLVLARLTSTGQRDTSFDGDDGAVTVDFGATANDGMAVAIAPDGRIVAAGFRYESEWAGVDSDVFLARFLGGTASTDTLPPDTSIDSGPAGATGDSTPTFGFSSEAGASFECRVGTAAFAPCSSPHTTAALGDGQHTLEVRATDAAGNVDASPASRTFTVDTSPPETTIDSGPTGTITDATPTFGFSSSEAGSSFECRFDTAEFAACVSPLTAATLDEGAHTFQVRASHGAGNVDASPASRSFTLDLPAPPPPDSDGDGVPNSADLCPSVPGTPARGGCPAPSPTTPTVPAPTVPSNVFSSIGKTLVKKNLTILTLSVPGPGNVKAAQAGTSGARASASKPLVKPARASAGKAGKVTLKVRPSKAGKKLLRKKRSFSVKLKITYTPTGGTPRSTTKRIKIKR
jgi:uncharacterized delta-60 repeat protein